MKRTFRNLVLIFVAIACYLTAYNVTNTGSEITATSLPKETVAVKIFGERSNGCLTLVKITSDEHFTVVKDPYPVYKTRWRTVKAPLLPEIVDMPLYLEPIPFNGITPLVVPDMADLGPLSDELAI